MLLQALLGVAAVFVFALAIRLIMIGRARFDRRLMALFSAAVALGLIASGRIVSGVVIGAIGALLAAGPGPDRVRPAARSRVRRENPAVADACALLGVSRGATEADIRSAYRQKIATAHPDQGGSAEAAATLTAARDLLLTRAKRR